MEFYNLHLVSDSTGETVGMLARACLVQFEDIDVEQHVWPMVRKKNQLKEVLDSIRVKPGLVLFTLVNPSLREALEKGCEEMKVPYLCVLDPVLTQLGSYFNAQAHYRPGRQHSLAAADYKRVEAINFTLNHDDGQATETLERADVVLVGVSRTSKTPTCLYLANRGIKAANVPVVPGCPLPEELFRTRRPAIIGLTKDPGRLVQVRKGRLELLNNANHTDYIELKTVRQEVSEAAGLCQDQGWPIIDVTHRSIEETAALVLQHLRDHRGT